ncbi:MAG: VIT domain-containing protein [Hyphomonadaceae bacterium]
MLSTALAYGEDGEERAGERQTRGLGELNARKPGTREELGGAVKLVDHAVRVRIAGLMARTEIEEVFENHTEQQLEGIYRFPIPAGAQIEQLSLEVDGKWEDGSFVDRDRAAAIWNGAIVNAAPQARPLVDDIVWVPGPWRDPALLEWQRGGRFELRIFPIPARGQRRVKLRYSELVQAQGDLRRYHYPLGRPAGSSETIERFEVDVELRGHDGKNPVHVSGYPLESRPLDSAAHYVYSSRGFVPSGDLGIEYTLPDARNELRSFAYSPSAAPDAKGSSRFAAPPTSSDAYVAIALKPRLPAAAETRARELAIVVDSSHSMFGESYDRAKRLATRLVRELDPDDRVVLLACDSNCKSARDAIQPGRRGEQDARSFFDSVQPGGASDPTRALAMAYRELSSSDRDARIVFISDGTPTMGAIRPAHVEAEVARDLPAARVRVTAVAVGPEADTETLSALARGGGGVLVRYQPGQGVAEAAFAVLGASAGRALRDVEVTLPEGMYAVAPTRLDAIPAGGEALVVARLRGERADGQLTLRGRVGDRPFEQHYPLHVVASAAGASAFVPRLYAAARIVDLERDGGQDAKREAIELSTRFSVASRYTSLLVLESQAMFQAFGLKQAQSVGDWSADEVAEGATAKAEATSDDVGEEQAGPALGAVDKKSRAASSGSGSGAGLDAYAEGKGDFAPPPPAAAAPAKAARARAESEAPADLGRSAAASAPKPAPSPMTPNQPLEPSLERRPLTWDDRPPVPPRRMIPMRRVWERTAEIASGRVQPKAASFEAIEQAERRSLSEPDHREPMKKLYTLLALSSDIGRAERVAQRWSERDPLDADALTARADLAARRGDRDAAIRMLGSVVDARPSDVAAQRRLERLERWSGAEALGCRHLVAAAELRQSDAKLLADAVRCSRKGSDEIALRELLAGASDSLRKDVEAKSALSVDDSVLSGDLQIQGRFEGGEDLDISLIDPDGQRVSWLGAPTRAVIAARDVLSREREGLSLRGAKPGQYLVELVRSRSSGPSVSGELEIRAAGTSQRVPFTLTGTRVSVALITVRLTPKLVPLEVPRPRPVEIAR